MRGIHIHVVDTKRTAILLLFGGLLVLGLILWGALAPDPAAQQQTPAYPQQIAGIPVTTDLVPDTNSNRDVYKRQVEVNRFRQGICWGVSLTGREQE